MLFGTGRQRGQHKGGCVLGNLSTALSDTHDAFAVA
jgi:hypothetical protein